MSKLPALALAAALLFPAAALASDAEVNLTDEITQQIQAKLTAEGYQVGKVKIEDGYYEAYARKDGQKMEVLLDANLEVVGTKAAD